MRNRTAPTCEGAIVVPLALIIAVAGCGNATVTGGPHTDGSAADRGSGGQGGGAGDAAGKGGMGGTGGGSDAGAGEGGGSGSGDAGSGGMGGPKGTFSDLTLMAGGFERHYSLHVPASYDPKKPIPVVIFLHGHGFLSVGSILSMFGAIPAADKNGFIAVGPLGCDVDGSSFAWCAGPAGVKKMDDDEFLDALPPHVGKQYNIDTKKIYLLGFSAGGFYSASYGFYRSTRITVAGVAGAGDSGAKSFEPEMAERKIPIFLRANSGDMNVSAAKALVDRLKGIGWPDADIDAKIGETSGGHAFRPEWTQEMWEWASRYALP